MNFYHHVIRIGMENVMSLNEVFFKVWNTNPLIFSSAKIAVTVMEDSITFERELRQ